MRCFAYKAEAGQRALLTAWRDLLEQPISLEEVHIAVRKRGKNKAPGSDSIGLEFYKANWATIQDVIGVMMNQMFMERTVSAHHKHGVIVCLPKSSDPTTSADCRPVEYGLQNNIPNHRLLITTHEGRAITSEPILRGAGKDHL